MKKFKPLLSPNEKVNLDNIQYPLLASLKLDGIRCIFYKGEILSRSLKQIPSKQLREKFEELRVYSEENNLILDGEIYSPEMTFQEITKFVMTKDYESKTSIKRNGGVLKIPDHLKFHAFDCITEDDYEEEFEIRVVELMFAEAVNQFDTMIVVNQVRVDSRIAVESFFEASLKDGNEGAMLRDPEAPYKCGRGTLKQGIIYKLKPYETFDAEITGVVQATVVDPSAEKTTNELGRSVTSKKKDDRIPIEMAANFLVKYEGLPLKVVIAATTEEKTKIWKDRDSYIGRTIEYKGMLVGSKDLPRHPIMLRFREDKDM